MAEESLPQVLSGWVEARNERYTVEHASHCTIGRAFGSHGRTRS